MAGTAIDHPFDGQRVEKWTGEARWTGICLVTYKTTIGSVRHLVEVEPQGFQMIATTEQLRLTSYAGAAAMMGRQATYADIASLAGTGE